MTLGKLELVGDVWIRTGEDGRYDRMVLKEKDWLELPISEADVVLDVGAYVGTFARLAAGHGARVISIEPDPDNYALLLRNVDGLTNVATVQAAVVGHVDGETVELLRALAPYGHSVNRGGRYGSTTVRAVEFAELLKTHEPTVVKIDIEGGEWNLLALWDLPDCVRVVAMELHLTRKAWRKTTEPSLLNSLRTQGFTLVTERICGVWRQNKVIVAVRG